MRTILRELFETVVLARLIYLTLHLSIQNFQVLGPSMKPTLEDGEYVLVNKLVYARLKPWDLVGLLPFVNVDELEGIYPFHSPRHGDVVIFRFCNGSGTHIGQLPGCPYDLPNKPARDFVKRVVAVHPDTVEIVKGQLFVNGDLVHEPYITHESSRSMQKRLVPLDYYFVLGDNRQESNDSRAWGPVPAENVIGQAWGSFWPLDRWQLLSIFNS